MQKVIITIMSLALLLSFAGTGHPNNVLANDESSITVTGEIVNLREGPGLTYSILKTFKKGETLTVIETSGDWYRVKSGRTEGWVASWLVEKLSNSTGANQYIISQVDNLNIRQQPSVSSAVLGQLFTGNEASLLKQQGDWVQIQYGSAIGWVAKSYVTIASKSSLNATSGNVPLTNDQTQYFTITVDAVNVRAEGSLDAKKMGVAYKGSKYKVLFTKNNWVQIAYENNTKAWIYSFYGSLNASNSTPASSDTSKGTVTVIYNGTNLRQEASTASTVVERANAGQTYTIIDSVKDFYKVQLSSGQTGYVANWVVSTNGQTGQSAATTLTTSTIESKKAKIKRKKGTLQGVTIVVDAGHGGNDHGTTGVRGTREKEMTLLTAENLTLKLRAAGATVYMTRESDTYVDLRKRVAVSHQVTADAFISLHYDANVDSSVQGYTTYYANSFQKELAQYVNDGMDKKATIKNRGVQYGNYLVLRENRQKAILIELGFLSNATEERTITTDYYREQATLGIYQGILNYFDDQL